VARRSTSRLALESAALLCAILAGAWWIFARAIYRAPPERGALSRTASAMVDEAIVEAVSGSVQRSTSHGDWAALAAGERLRADDSLRTGKGASTDLRIDRLEAFGGATDLDLAADAVLAPSHVGQPRLQAPARRRAPSPVRRHNRGT